MVTLKWTHDAREIVGRPLDVVREADTAERAIVAEYLGVLSCERFRVHYSLQSLEQGKAALSGNFDAEITQGCVVTLEPIVGQLEGSFSAELWPRHDLPAIADNAVDALADDEPEPIDNGVIDVGRIVLERLADRVDPYPRKPGAAFSWTDDKAATDGSDSPFAKLKNLRPSS